MISSERDEYCVALYYGTRSISAPGGGEHRVLVEIYEWLPVVDRYRYRAWELRTGDQLKVIEGKVGSPEENGDRPPNHVLNALMFQGFTWKRLR